MYYLRDALEKDFDFLYNLNISTAKDYIAQTWGWDDEFQLKYFKTKFRSTNYKIISVDNKDIGALSLRQDGSKIFIKRIQILPQFQHRGIGSEIISDVIKCAEENNAVVCTKVLKVNPAKKLYNKLGFSYIGETPTHYLMNTRFKI